LRRPSTCYAGGAIDARKNTLGTYHRLGTRISDFHAALNEAGVDKMDIHNLTDKLELDDTVAGVYRKSLLCLVSRSFEDGDRLAPILGMQKHGKGVTIGLKNVNIQYRKGSKSESPKTTSETHGRFDNDEATMNSVLRTILGKKPAKLFTKNTLQY
jgi:hypothetical protein